MGCGKVISHAWHDVVGTTQKALSDTVNTTLKASHDAISFGLKVGFTLTDTIARSTGQTWLRDFNEGFYDILNVTNDVLYQFNKTILTDTKSLFVDENGNFSFMKTISLIVAICLVPATGGLSLAAWYIINSGAISAITSQMAKNGWIDAKTAMILTIVATIAVAVMGSPTGGLDSTSSVGNYMSTIDSLVAAGVSVQTATTIVSALYEVSVFMSSAAFSTVMSGYSVYETVNSIHQMDMQYKAQVAAYESWYSQLKKESDKKDAEVNAFVSGRYYRYFAGQQLYNVGQSSRERFVPMSVQAPCYGMFGEQLVTEDEFISKLMWKDKNYNLPAGSSFMNQQMSGAMVQLGN